MHSILKYITAITYWLILVNSGFSQETPEEKGLRNINMNTIQAQVGFLASDWMEGREAGEKGEYLAGEYIASMMRLYGVKPGGDINKGIPVNSFGDERSYFQNFLLQKTINGEEQLIKLTSTDGSTSITMDLSLDIDFKINSPTGSVEAEGPVVLVNNDIRKAEKLNEAAVKGKFILKSRYTGAKGLSSEREFEKVMRNLGAAGILEYDPNVAVLENPQREYLNTSPSERTPVSRRPGESWSIPGRIQDNFIKITLSSKAANELLKGSQEIHNESYITLEGKSVYIKTTAEISLVPVRNILGVIEGNNPDKIIIVGAHYDHVGVHNGYTWNGADDNASGTAGIMTIAKAIMETGVKPENTIIFAFWTSEEKGLLGSRYYVQNPLYPIKNVRLNVNFDMISRYVSEQETRKVTMTYTSSESDFRRMTADNLKKYGIDLDIDYQPSPDPPGGTDHRSFVAAGIPIMRFKPGHREEYHTPMDETETLDWDIMEKILKISFLNIWELANTGK